MDARSLISAARRSQGLTQESVARRSGTSQPTLSAYERGTKSPTLAVLERILHTLGYELGLQPRVTFREVRVGRQTFVVPDRLWRLDPADCFAPMILHEADGKRRTLHLGNRSDRIDAYVWLLRNGDETQLIEHVDGALLVDAWSEIRPRLPQQLRRLWEPLILHAAEGWADERLIAGLQAGRPPKVSRRALARAIKRLAEHGLSADEIRRVLRRR